MKTTSLSVTPPEDFNFAVTVDSYGWERLEPFSLDRGTGVLRRLERLPSQPARLELAFDRTINVTVCSESRLRDEDERYVRAFVDNCLALDLDLSGCYAQLAADPAYRFIAERKLGRPLRAPTMWENLVKTLFLTNTTARQTATMAARFCTLGDSFDKRHVFPTPEQVLRYSAEDLGAETATGYRAKYVRRLAEAVAGGGFDPESLRDPSLGDEAVAAKITALPGFGAFSARHVLRLLGRFGQIGTDAVLRRYFEQMTGQENATDKAVNAYYDRFGRFKGLVAFWDVSRRADEKGELKF